GRFHCGGGLRAARAGRISRFGAVAHVALRCRSMSDVAAATGQLLKAERERRGLSAQKAADELRLHSGVIDALEAEDYERVGPAVYAKGHLKRYAAYLGLSSAEIMAGYDSRVHAPEAPASQPAPAV